jgi:exopolysaccharide biosynthesis polyprenyl glycosylphosphotransferase
VPFTFWNNTSTPTFYLLTKRITDIVLGLVGLIGLVLLFPIIALAIYLDSPGPIFYRQERSGKGGKTFNVFKFRSMIPNAETQGKAVWATKDDPRVTHVGKFLRRTRLDELPQVINVLFGDMSIVGPRPERPQFIEQLQESIPFYRARLSVKPGLTGWAQVKYRYGSSVEDALMKLQYDLYYIKHQSLLLDALVILRTVKVVLTFKGT